jgi:hypothetical protein
LLLPVAPVLPPPVAINPYNRYPKIVFNNNYDPNNYDTYDGSKAAKTNNNADLINKNQYGQDYDTTDLN